MVRKREDGRWEGRIVIGHKQNGDSIFRHVYAKTREECEEKLKTLIVQMKAEISEAKKKAAEGK